jgi:hypothetical protein
VRSFSVSDDAVVLWKVWTDSFCYRALAQRWSKGGSNNGHLHSAAQIAASSVIDVSPPPRAQSTLPSGEQRHPVAPRCCGTKRSTRLRCANTKCLLLIQADRFLAPSFTLYRDPRNRPHPAAMRSVHTISLRNYTDRFCP